MGGGRKRGIECRERELDKMIQRKKNSKNDLNRERDRVWSEKNQERKRVIERDRNRVEREE